MSSRNYLMRELAQKHSKCGSLFSSQKKWLTMLVAASQTHVFPAHFTRPHLVLIAIRYIWLLPLNILELWKVKNYKPKKKGFWSVLKNHTLSLLWYKFLGSHQGLLRHYQTKPTPQNVSSHTLTIKNRSFHCK